MGLLGNDQKNVYIVEHLDPELGPWSALEYRAIAEESEEQFVSFCLSSVPKELELPSELRDHSNLIIEHRGVEDIFQATKERVCLLDPAASAELSPEDGGKFNVFLFGGILGDDPPRVPLDQIPYLDHPELRLDEHESTEMPFRYVKDVNGLPVMPEGMLDLIKRDSEKGFGDLL